MENVVAKAFAKLDKVERIKNLKDVTASYKYLKVMAKGTGLEVHHLIEKRYANTIELKANDILSIAIDKKTHDKITKLFRKKNRVQCN